MAIKYCDFTNGVDYNALSAWAVSTAYSVDDMVKDGTAAYKCISAHTSTADDEPGVGANWETYWSLESDGSAANPYKTITQASTGLTGGDEVRVAKSPADTTLTGTLGFTLGSTAVTGSGTLFTTELAIGDFVKGGDGQWYEIVTITDDTNAVLYKVYPGTTGTGVTGYKLGITSTGEAASSSTHVQEVSASGSSAASKLKISGGWDLGTTTQDGQTYFKQMHSTFANRYGYGLYSSYKNYVEIERCHFLRYYNGIYLYHSSNNTITSPTCNSNNNYGIYLNFSYNNTITSPTCNSNNNYGIHLYFSLNNTITSPTCNSNNYGIYLYTSLNNTITSSNCNSNSNNGIQLDSSLSNSITSPTCNSNNSYGIFSYSSSNNTITSPTCNSNNNNSIYLDHSSNNTITSPTCNSNTYGVYLDTSSNVTINKYSGTGNSNGDIYVVPGKVYSENPCAKCQHFKATGTNKCFYEYGITERDTANARSTQCLKYDPTSATYYISQSFFFKADSGVAQTLSAYIKDDTDFNGDVQAAIYFMGEKITGWTEWSTTTDYVQKSIAAAAGDITEDGVLELRIKCRATAGNVFVDDLATS